MKPVAIQFALANTHGRVDGEQLLTFIEDEGSEIETYERVLPPPGTIRAAAVDYGLVLGIAGSIASIASLLWQAYKKFVVPVKKHDDSAGIFVAIRSDNHVSKQFWIGHLQKGEEAFVREFTAVVQSIRNSPDDEHTTNQVIAELRNHEMWVRRK